MEKKDTDHSAENRDQLANERTYLAWVRTCIGIIAFGFVIEKFSLFLGQMSSFFGKPDQSLQLNSEKLFPSLFGKILILIGMTLCALAFLQYKSNVRHIDQHTFYRSTTLGTIAAVIVIAVGACLLVYLIS